MLTCKQLIGFIADYLDGTLPKRERSAFEKHLRVCPDCVNYLDSYQMTIRAGKAAIKPTNEPPPKSVPRKLVNAILAANPARRPRGRRQPGK